MFACCPRSNQMAEADIPTYTNGHADYAGRIIHSPLSPQQPSESSGGKETIKQKLMTL